MISVVLDNDPMVRDDYRFISSTFSNIYSSGTVPISFQRNAFDTKVLNIDSDNGSNVETNVNRAINDDDPLTAEELMDIDESLMDLEAGRYFVISEEMSGKDIVRKILEFGKNE